MIDYKEYSRQRDIAQKRLKRLDKAGKGLGIQLPTVADLRAMTDPEKVAGIASGLSNFLESGTSLSRIREASRPRYTEEQRRQRKREQSRDYRRRKVAKQYERPNSTKYQSYVKALKTLGVDIPPSKLPAFFNYMDFRFAQGNAGAHYVFDIYVEDYTELLRQGYKPDAIVQDFMEFEYDQISLGESAGEMVGRSFDDVMDTWNRFVYEREEYDE